MEKYKVDKQGKLKIRDKKKIFKILRLIYDICSAIFILFVCVGLIISSSPRDDHNDSANQHIPNIQEKARREYTDLNNTRLYPFAEILGPSGIKYLDEYFIQKVGHRATQSAPTTGSWTGYDYVDVSGGNVWGNLYVNTDTTNPTTNRMQLKYMSVYSGTSGSYTYLNIKFCENATMSNSNKAYFFITIYGVGGVDYDGIVVSAFRYYGASALTQNMVYFNGPISDSYNDDYYNGVNSSGFTQEDIDEAYDNGFDEGYEQGEIHGMDIAADPSSEIYQTTYQTGYDDGYEEGYNDGQNNVAPIDSQLIISSDYDFRGLITQQIDSPTGLMRVGQSSGGLTEITNLDLKGLTFKVGDNVYNEIRLSYISLDANNTIYDSVNLQYKTAQQYFGNDYVYYRGLVNVTYRYVENGTITKETRVFNGVQYDYEDDNGSSLEGFNYSAPKWSNGVFRTIIIVSDNGVKQNTPSFGDSFSTYELLKLNGSQLIHIDNNVFNVFSLLTQAFNSVGGILSIAIIPGISIGLLMFIPLIVTIILFIIHMIKK